MIVRAVSDGVEMVRRAKQYERPSQGLVCSRSVQGVYPSALYSAQIEM